MHLKCWWENLTERDHLEELPVDGKIILKENLIQHDDVVWMGFVLPTIGTTSLLNSSVFWVIKRREVV